MAEPNFTCRLYPAKNPRRVLFFFTGFRTKNWHFTPAYKSLNNMGYDVHAYEFPTQAITNGTIDYYVEILDDLLVDIHGKILEYTKQGIAEFATFGVSMGSIYSNAVAKRTPQISKMVFVTGYGSGALQIWEHPPMKKLRSYQLYSEENYTVEQAAERYPVFEAGEDIQKLKGKKLLFYASRTDKTIRLHNTQIFIDKAEAADLDIEVVIGRGSHLQFIADTVIRGKRWRQFLAE